MTAIRYKHNKILANQLNQTNQIIWHNNYDHLAQPLLAVTFGLFVINS